MKGFALRFSSGPIFSIWCLTASMDVTETLHPRIAKSREKQSKNLFNYIPVITSNQESESKYSLEKNIHQEDEIKIRWVLTAGKFYLSYRRLKRWKRSKGQWSYEHSHRNKDTQKRLASKTTCIILAKDLRVNNLLPYVEVITYIKSKPQDHRNDDKLPFFRLLPERQRRLWCDLDEIDSEMLF